MCSCTHLPRSNRGRHLDIAPQNGIYSRNEIVDSHSLEHKALRPCRKTRINHGLFVMDAQGNHPESVIQLLKEPLLDVVLYFPSFFF